MKKILFMLNDCMRRFSYERTASLYRAIRDMGEPASLYIIRTDGHSEFAPEHNRGEYNIFHLPDYREFDGIILDINSVFNGDSASYSAGVLHAVQAAAASDRPVISMANGIEDFCYVGIDNYAAMGSVIHHLHQARGLTDFWFAMGPKDNFEGRQRAKALADYCREHRLPCENHRFHYDSFTVDGGISAFDRLRQRHAGKLPQAVICGNDRIAMGVCHAAEQAGLAIPRDFMVTGFDNDDISASLSPSITSIDQLGWNMGAACVNTLQRVWRGEALPERVFTPTELVPRESTGEAASDRCRSGKPIGEYISQTFGAADFGYRLSALQYQLPGCQSIEEICIALIRCLSALNIKGMRMILDSTLFDNGRVIQIHDRSGRMRDIAEGMLTNGYPDTMETVFSWEAGKNAQFKRERVGSKLRTSLYSAEGENYLFAPLHFMEYTVGYLCIRDCLDLMAIQGVSEIVNALSVALRNFFARRNLSYINQVLSGVSMKDDLTGLYNRLGYHDLAYPLFRKTCTSGGKMGILFIDMDRLKYINDTFGHAQGDLAIRSTANAIRRSLPKDGIPVRYGGDEFLILAPVGEEADVRRWIDAIAAALPPEAAALGAPGDFGFSAGYLLTDPTLDKSLDEYVTEADARMYRDKRAKKQRRGE